MTKNIKVLALIPARSGSKSLPDKNIRPLAGKPLLVYSIDHALASKSVGRTVVSTDSPRYAEIARACGAETPFLRPAEIAQDYSTDLEVFRHALTWLEKNEDYKPEICVHLRPTYPIRNSEDIDAAIQILMENSELDSVRSVTKTALTPMKMWFRKKDGLLTPVVSSAEAESCNLPRQLLTQAFIQNACLDVVRTRVILEQNSMTGKRIYGYEMNHFFDIDCEEDFKEVERVLTGVVEITRMSLNER